MQRTADCVVRIREQFKSYEPFRRAALPIEKRDECERCEMIVLKSTRNISENGFAERRLGCHISLMGRVVFVVVSGIGQVGDVVVVAGGTQGC